MVSWLVVKKLGLFGRDASPYFNFSNFLLMSVNYPRLIIFGSGVLGYYLKSGSHASIEGRELN